MSDRKAAKRIDLPQAAVMDAAQKAYRIDDFFNNLLPPLTVEQRRDLKEGIRRNEKCDALKAARIKGMSGLPILWDGHNRDQIVAELRAEGASVADPVVEVSDSENRSEVALEMIRNQDGRRNWTVAEKAFAIVSALSSSSLICSGMKHGCGLLLASCTGSPEMGFSGSSLCGFAFSDAPFNNCRSIIIRSATVFGDILSLSNFALNA